MIKISNSINSNEVEVFNCNNCLQQTCLMNLYLGKNESQLVCMWHTLQYIVLHIYICTIYIHIMCNCIVCNMYVYKCILPIMGLQDYYSLYIINVLNALNFLFLF